MKLFVVSQHFLFTYLSTYSDISLVYCIFHESLRLYFAYFLFRRFCGSNILSVVYGLVVVLKLLLVVFEMALTKQLLT